MKNLISTGLLVLIAVAGYCQDLVITGVTGAKTFDQYELFTVSITLQNQGIVDITVPTFVGAYLSTDAIADGDDVAVGSFYIPSIKAGESQIPQFDPYGAVRPLPGNYYLILEADDFNAQDETDESNNVIAVSDYIVSPPILDFSFQSFALNKSSVAINDVVVPAYTVMNNGGVSTFAGSAYTSFYLSTDNAYDASDVRLGWRYDTFESGKASSNPWAQLAIPNTPTGQYYIIARADRNYDDQSEFNEIDENNNTASAPLTLVNSDIDLDVTGLGEGSARYIEGGQSEIRMEFRIKNNGTTGATGYATYMYLSADRVLDANDYLVNDGKNSHGGTYVPSGGDYVSAGADVTFGVPDPRMLGTNYVIAKVNPDGFLAETNTNNNVVVSIAPITINPPVVDLEILDQTLSGTYNRLEDQLDLEVTIINRGSMYTGSVSNKVSIRNSSNIEVYSVTMNDNVYMNPSDTHTLYWSLPLNGALAPGEYSLTVQTLGDPASYTIPLVIDKAVFTFSGIVKGEDGVHISKGKVFLYRKENGVTKFVDQRELTTDSAFSFQVDTRQYTLYFIPDKTAFPEYVPTIFGKTIVLDNQSFVSLTEDKAVSFVILKVKPLANGAKVISGTVSQTENPVGRGSVGGLSVILLSASGDVVGLTQTDDTGFYQFTNLPEGKYQVLISFALDEVQMDEPIAADVTLRNAQVDISVSPEGTQGHVTEILLNQHITFGTLSGKRYADAPFALEATTDATLPLSFTSSHPEVARIEAGKVIIVSAGTTTITALQQGDDIYQPATPVERTLVVSKALQQISFSEIGLAERTDDIALDAVATSALPVSYVSEHPNVATVEGQVLKIHGSGETLISALQPGNENYEPAATVSRKLTVQLVTGIEDPLANVTVHPNPTADFLTFSSSSPIRQVAITDVTGRSQELMIADRVADLRKFEAGVYVVKVQYGNGVKVFKVVKE